MVRLRFDCKGTKRFPNPSPDLHHYQVDEWVRKYNIYYNYWNSFKGIFRRIFNIDNCKVKKEDLWY